MLKVEIIKFEAQDVITASVAYVECACTYGCKYDGNGHIHHAPNGVCGCQLKGDPGHIKAQSNE